VKRYVSFCKQDILQFTNDFGECIPEKQNEVSKATIGLGRWSLSLSYSHIKQNGSSWFNKKDRLSSLCTTPPLDQSTSGEIDVDIDYDTSLPVPYTSVPYSWF